MPESNKVQTDVQSGPTGKSNDAAHPNLGIETDTGSSDEAAVQTQVERLYRQPFLIFRERGIRYALPASMVRESLRLPRLTALEETAPWVLGAFELRGELVPLLSPALCLRHPPIPAARLSAIAVVADCAGHPLAFHADEITTLARARRVLPIPTDATGDSNIIAYEIALDDGIARVLEPTRVRLHAADAAEVSDLPDQRLNRFEQALDAAALQQLSARAVQYSKVPNASAQHRQQSFILLGIGGETLAAPAAECLELVRIGTLVPVPGTPEHILGFAALRGEVITVVDVRSALGLASQRFWEPPLMVVIRFGGQRTGIAIDAAFALQRTPLGPCEELPLALRTAGEGWLRGAIHVDADHVQSDAGSDAGPASVPDSGLDTRSDKGSGADREHNHPIPVVDLGALLERGRLVVDGPP